MALNESGARKIHSVQPISRRISETVQNRTKVTINDQSRWKDPRTPRPGGGGGLTYAQGPHVTYVKIFLVF